MRTEEFEQLLASVREGGAILRGEIKPSRRAFDYSAVTANRPLERAFAICVETDDPELLILNKIYQVTMLLENDLLKVEDEAGEAALYPADYFLLVSFPTEVEQILARVAER